MAQLTRLTYTLLYTLKHMQLTTAQEAYGLPSPGECHDEAGAVSIYICVCVFFYLVGLL